MTTKFKTKICPTCGIEKDRSEYYKKGSTVSYRCKPCSLIECKKKASKYIGKYLERQNEWRRKQEATNPDYVARRKALKKIRYEIRKDELNDARREDWANNPFCSAKAHHRRKDVKNRTPKWVNTKDILSIYALCPKGFHVDHIIPLKGFIDGRPVTGLHVPYNLQYLTPEDNHKKYNLITETYLASIPC